MKQDPYLNAVEKQMKSGYITKEGFLGTDTRRLIDILNDDQATVNELGIDHEQIAARLKYLLEKAKEGLGTEVLVDDRFLVMADDVRGRLSCPWGHKGMYPKTNVHLKNIQNNEEIIYTALHIHLIGSHGFYEGRGSRFRLDPQKLKKVLDL